MYPPTTQVFIVFVSNPGFTKRFPGWAQDDVAALWVEELGVEASVDVGTADDELIVFVLREDELGVERLEVAELAVDEMTEEELEAVELAEVEIRGKELSADELEVLELVVDGPRVEELEVKGWEIEEALLDSKLVLDRLCIMELVVAIAALGAISDEINVVVEVLEPTRDELDNEEAKWKNADEADLDADEETGLHVPKPCWHPTPQ